MKRVFFIFCMIVLWACTAEVDKKSGTVLQAGISNTRTALQEDLNVFWTAGDAIVVNGVSSNSISIDSPAPVAEFSWDVELETPYKAVFPVSVYKDATTITLPAVQEAGTNDSFSDRSVPMAAYLESEETLVFHHLVSVIRFSVTGNGEYLSNVKFTGNAGEQVCGDFTLDYQTAALTPASTSATTKSVSVEVGKTLSSTATMVYIAVPAGIYASGFTVRLTDIDGHFMEKKVNGSRTFTAGEIRSMPSFVFAPTGTGLGSGIEDFKEVDEIENVTVSGKVYDNNGNGLAGVVVSDGFNCVRTSETGEYALGSDLSKVKFISVSIPSGHKVASSNGLAMFYKRLSDETAVGGVYEDVDFHLQKPNGDPDRCTIIMSADPQSRTKGATLDNVAFHSLDVQKDVYQDIGDYAAGISGHEVYGIVLGDLVHENMSLFSNYITDIKRTGIPTFNVIGNHDHNPSAANDAAGAADYENRFGPTNYSFNIGKFHFVVLDDMIMKTDTDGTLTAYNTGLTDEALEWLRQDLHFVPRNTPIMLCAHSPMFRQKNGSDRWHSSNTVNGKAYAELLGRYDKVYTWAGHSHSMFNHSGEGTDYPNIESHVLTRCTGEFWTNENISADGCPRSYLVIDLDGDNISWKLKPLDRETAVNARGNLSFTWNPFTKNSSGKLFRKDGSALDSSWQIHAYPKNAYGDGYVYANVLMYDELWDAVTFVDSNGNRTAMERVTDTNKMYDRQYKENFEWYNSHVSNLSDRTFSTDTASSLFRCSSSIATGSGHVEAVDRFGNTFISDTVSW